MIDNPHYISHTHALRLAMTKILDGSWEERRGANGGFNAWACPFASTQIWEWRFESCGDDFIRYDISWWLDEV